METQTNSQEDDDDHLNHLHWGQGEEGQMVLCVFEIETVGGWEER
jgi:hypothetical protein